MVKTGLVGYGFSYGYAIVFLIAGFKYGAASRSMDEPCDFRPDPFILGIFVARSPAMLMTVHSPVMDSIFAIMKSPSGYSKWIKAQFGHKIKLEISLTLEVGSCY